MNADDYGLRPEQRAARAEPFRVVGPQPGNYPPQAAVQAGDLDPPAPSTPAERAKPVLDAIAEDILWLPWDLMETLAKEMLGEDGKAGTIVKWAKTRLGRD